MLFWWFWPVRCGRLFSRCFVESPLETEDVSDINKELEGLSPDELEDEFEQIDQDLNNL